MNRVQKGELLIAWVALTDQVVEARVMPSIFLIGLLEDLISKHMDIARARILLDIHDQMTKEHKQPLPGESVFEAAMRRMKGDLR